MSILIRWCSSSGSAGWSYFRFVAYAQRSAIAIARGRIRKRRGGGEVTVMHRLALILLLVSGPVLAAPVTEDPIERQMIDIAKGLRCAVCQNQPVSESNADLARDMRAIILDQLKQGKIARGNCPVLRCALWRLRADESAGPWTRPAVVGLAGGCARPAGHYRIHVPAPSPARHAAAHAHAYGRGSQAG